YLTKARERRILRVVRTLSIIPSMRGAGPHHSRGPAPSVPACGWQLSMEVMMSRTGTRSHDGVDLRPLEGEAAEIDDLDRRAGVADEEEQEAVAQEAPATSTVVDEADVET